MWIDGTLVSSAVLSTLLFALVSYKFRSKLITVNLLLGINTLFGLYIFSILTHQNLNAIPSLLYNRIFDGTDRSYNFCIIMIIYFRISILLFWTMCVLASLIFCNYVSYTKYSSTVHRKFFHFTISLVCISGILCDPELLWLSAAIILCGFVILEILRSLRVAPWAEYLDSFCLVFIDKQDSPSLILTPIYLIIGVFLPLFLKPVENTESHSLFHYAGVLTVGVGDSFAAIIGSIYGRHFWPNSHKTYEGSLAMLLSQIIFALCVVWYENMLSLDCMKVLRIFASSLVCTIAEAKLHSIDNVILPLIAYFILW
uniref:dolichol kinase n=1 Tax=Syphacia muris TaxID=451379 RepID=A0A0N5AD07_9BILA